MNDKIFKAKLAPAETGAAPALASAKVLKRDAFDATVEARGIVEAAQAQARAILEEAGRQRDATVEAAREEGYERGLSEWNLAVAAANAARERFLADSEAELIRLAVRISEKIVGEELKTRPEAIAGIVRECLQGIRRERMLSIHVNPEHAGEVRNRLDSLQQAVGADRRVDVAADPAVPPGGCIVESELGVIDARLETQLKCLEEILLRAMRK